MELPNTNPNPEGADVDKLDSIANTLLGDEQTDETLEGQDGVGVEGEKPQPTKKSTGESEETESDDDAESEETESEETDEEPEESDDEEVTWSAVLGVDDSKIELDEEGNFTGVKVKVDGEESTVNMESLIAGYQNNRHNANTSKALADEKRQFEQVRDETVTVYTQKLEDVSKLTEHLHTQLTREFQNIDWQNLRATNPAEYAATMQDFNVRQAEIQSIYSAIEQERNRAKSEVNAKTQEQHEAHLKQQIDILLDKNPEWKQPEKMKAAFSEMDQFASEVYGFKSEEFNSVQDARIFELLQDAMKYRQGLEKATSKTVKRVPKMQKKATGNSKPVSKLEKLTRAASKAKTGTERRDLQTSAIAELIS